MTRVSKGGVIIYTVSSKRPAFPIFNRVHSKKKRKTPQDLIFLTTKKWISSNKSIFSQCYNFLSRMAPFLWIALDSRVSRSPNMSEGANKENKEKCKPPARSRAGFTYFSEQKLSWPSFWDWLYLVRSTDPFPGPSQDRSYRVQQPAAGRWRAVGEAPSINSSATQIFFSSLFICFINANLYKGS